MHPKKPNIVFILIDAVRAQNLPFYGYPKKTMPLLEKMLPQMMLYKYAISTSYWTLPSCASTFTGTYLSTHGLTVDGDLLRPDFVTLAEMLKVKGYKTIGISPNDYVSSYTGLDRGFDNFYGYESVADPLKKINKTLFLGLPAKKIVPVNDPNINANSPTTSVTSSLLSKVYKRSRGFLTAYFIDKGAKKTNQLVAQIIPKIKRQPFFMYLHYNEAHDPYYPPEPHRSNFLASHMRRKIWEINQDRLQFHLGKTMMNHKDFEVLKGLYDGAINYLDKRITEVFSILMKENLFDDTLIIITADHGDNIGEHGLMSHIWCLYDTLIRVPLILKFPQHLNRTGVDDKIVQNVDIMPTLIDLLNVQNQRLLAQIQGNSLLTNDIIKRNGSYAISELMKPFSAKLFKYSTTFKKYNRGLLSIRDKEYKYIWSTNKKSEFYDLRKDPEENHNIINSECKCIPKLRKELQLWLIQYSNMYARIKDKVYGPPESQIDNKVKMRLQELGYF